jgi:cyanophycin synthetase
VSSVLGPRYASAGPNPATEIRLKHLVALRGANYWSRRPVTRMDLAVGRYDHISSADVPDFEERLLAALPGLARHRCSLGSYGGFVERLRRGTYAPHIAEHVALELQVAIGHDVGYGRARGGDAPGEYTLVVEHLHEAVGLRAVAAALDTVQHAFARTLGSVEHVLAELRALAATPDVPAPTHDVRCAITGGRGRSSARRELAFRGIGPSAHGEARESAAQGASDEALVVELAPAFLLQQGLPFRHSDAAIVLDVEPLGVPSRYRTAERAARLMNVIVDGAEGDVVVAPAEAQAVLAYAHERGCRLAVFGAAGTGRPRVDPTLCQPQALAWVEGGRIRLEQHGRPCDLGEVRTGVPDTAQLAAALASVMLHDPEPPRAGADAAA